MDNINEINLIMEIITWQRTLNQYELNKKSCNVAHGIPPPFHNRESPRIYDTQNTSNKKYVIKIVYTLTIRQFPQSIFLRRSTQPNYLIICERTPRIKIKTRNSTRNAVNSMNRPTWDFYRTCLVFWVRPQPYELAHKNE